MNKYIGILFLIFMFSSCGSVKKYNKQISGLHTPEELRADVDVVYLKLKKFHPKLYQFVSKESLDFKFDSLKKTITAPMSSTDFYKKLTPVVFEVRQGHIGISPPSKRFTKKEWKAKRKNFSEFDDLEFENVNDAFLIKQNYGIDSTIVGAEVLKVDGKPINEALSDYKKLFSSDGFNNTFHDRLVGLRFSSLYYKENGRVDSLPLALKLNDSVFTKMFRTIPKDSIKNILKSRDSLKTKDSLKTEKKVLKLTKVEKKAKKKKAKLTRKNNYKYGFIRSKRLSPKAKTYTRNFNFIGEDSSVAYLKISNFSTGKYKDFYEEVFVKIDSAETKNLVIDLRDNTGGRLAEIENLYSYLATNTYQFIEKGQTKTRFPFLKTMYSSNRSVVGTAFNFLIVSPIAIPFELLKGSKKDGIRYYKFPSSKENKTPNPLFYKGKIYVLINGNSYSASSILSTKLHATKRATFVGEETGGHYNGTVAGLTKYLELPNSKVKLSFGLIQLQTPHQTEVNGYGIFPDVEIIPTKEDRAKGVDPELNWILNDIKK